MNDVITLLSYDTYTQVKRIILNTIAEERKKTKEKNIKETVVYPFISKARDLSYGENKIIIYTQ